MTRGVLAGLFVLLCLVGIAMADVPKLPMSIDGFVMIDGNPAPAGTVVAATGTGVYPGTATITLTTPGQLGNPGDSFAEKIQVQGSKLTGMIPDGGLISFTVNGIPAMIRTSGTTTSWMTTILYTPGNSVYLDIAIGQMESPQVDPTPVPTVPPPTPEPTQEPKQVTTQYIPPYAATPPPGVSVPCETKSTVSIYTPSKSNCPGTFWYGVPSGYGILRVEGTGSFTGWYLNDVFIGGTGNLFGVPPGHYTAKFRKSGVAPTDIPIDIVSGQLTRVTVDPCSVVSMGSVNSYASWRAVMDGIPNNLKWYGEPMAVGFNREQPINPETVDGSFTCDPYMDGMSVQIDDRLYAPCDIPCDFTWRLSPGFHRITYYVTNTDGSATHSSSFPIIICVGTNTFVNGALPSSGFNSYAIGSPCGDTIYKVYSPPGETYHGPDYHGI